jgi:2-iminoacetate synthase
MIRQLSNMQVYSQSGCDFIDDARFEALLQTTPDSGRLREIIAKSLEKKPLDLEETAMLLAADASEMVEQIFDAARQLKRDVYGNRIVIFAPLYIGNKCMNDCRYCAFRASNPHQIRQTLSRDEIREEVEIMLNRGHKRTIIVFGEHSDYPPEYIADCVRYIYSIQTNSGASLRRINVNAAPLDHEGYKIVKEAGIGTYQVFQETYHRPTYQKMHPPQTRKGDFNWRLDSHARALEVGTDDVGIGALIGLYDWKYETLGLVAHAIHLMKHYNVGPHTISFPRIRPANGVNLAEVVEHDTNDQDFLRLIAILRLSVPYTGLILTAREPAEIRREALGFGVSQIDAGSRIDLGGYTDSKAEKPQTLERGQFHLGDERSLDEVVRQLLEDGYVPSFCTACYRLGRTGEVFMEYAKPGFIQNFCTPNALATLEEYLVDYASPETREIGEKAIDRELEQLKDDSRKKKVLQNLELIKTTNKRDLFF